MTSRDSRTNCPICYREFAVVEIENHVNKCIFLNSGDSEGTSSKRISDNKETSPSVKKQRKDDPAPKTDPRNGFQGQSRFSKQVFSVTMM